MERRHGVLTEGFTTSEKSLHIYSKISLYLF
jgi:hypothetical protein